MKGAYKWSILGCDFHGYIYHRKTIHTWADIQARYMRTSSSRVPISTTYETLIDESFIEECDIEMVEPIYYIFYGPCISWSSA